MMQYVCLSPFWAQLMELCVLFIALPLCLVLGDLHAWRHLILLAGTLYILCRLRSCCNIRHLFARPPAGWWCWPLCRGSIGALAIVVYVYLREPQLLFSLPRTHPALWLLVVCAYPLLSVIPQELLYRVYIFGGYPQLWRRPWQPVCASALLFGWVHIIFTGWFALVTTTLGGWVLALSYAHRRYEAGAIWPIALEHSIYGLSMFTFGLGKYFFLPR